MKILFLADEECPYLWDYYQPGRLDGYDLIVSCGDLKPSYLSFLVTMSNKPVLYVQQPRCPLCPNASGRMRQH